MAINIYATRQQLIHFRIPDWYLKFLFSIKDFEQWENEIDKLALAIIENRVETYMDYKEKLYKLSENVIKYK